MIRWNQNEVRMAHVPTGIEAKANGHRSQHRNRDSAYQQLRGKIYASAQAACPEVVATYTMPDGEPYPDDLTRYRRNLK